MLTLSNCQFGFILERAGDGDNASVNYSIVIKLKGEEVFTHSQRAHPLLSDYTQVFEKDSSFINVCDRFMNLFSSSNTSYNHDLVNAFLTHETLEKSSELIQMELESSQKNYSYVLDNYNHYNELLKSSQFFEHIEEFSKALDCEDEIELYEDLDVILQCLRRCNGVLPIIDISTEQILRNIYDILCSLKQKTSIIDTDMLVSVMLMNDIVTNLQPTFPSIDTSNIEYLININDSITALQEVKQEIDTNDIELLLELYPILDSIVPAAGEIDASLIDLLFTLYINLYKLALNEEKHGNHQREINKLSASIEGFKYECPIKGTVYVIGGECLSAGKVI